MNFISPFLAAVILGFNSGINYALIGVVLTVYLRDFKVGYILLGFLSLRMLPYSLKGLWSPMVDIIPIRLFPTGFGHRKSWIITMQTLAMICFLLLAFINPTKYLIVVCIIAFIAAFFASTYDNALYGYMIDSFNEKEQSRGNTFLALSFKVGFFITFTGSLIISEYYNWPIVFIIFALLIIPCIFIILFSNEKKQIVKNLSISQSINQIRRNYFRPFFALLGKPYALWVIIIVMFFKVSDSFMDTLLVPYLLEMGFTKIQTAGFNNVTGFISYSLGTVIGGYILYKNYNILKVMICVELLASISNLGFIIFLNSNNPYLLVIVSFFESLCSSMCNIALITFISYFCKSTIRFTASFYAILQSLSLLNRLIISSFSGLIVMEFGWSYFFILSSLLSIPTFITCYYLLQKTKKTDLFNKIKILS